MNVIGGCPVEFARAFVTTPPHCSQRDFYQGEKRASISVTLAVLADCCTVTSNATEEAIGDAKWQ